MEIRTSVYEVRTYITKKIWKLEWMLFCIIIQTACIYDIIISIILFTITSLLTRLFRINGKKLRRFTTPRHACLQRYNRFRLNTPKDIYGISGPTSWHFFYFLRPDLLVLKLLYLILVTARNPDVFYKWHLFCNLSSKFFPISTESALEIWKKFNNAYNLQCILKHLFDLMLSYI